MCCVVFNLKSGLSSVVLCFAIALFVCSQLVCGQGDPCVTPDDKRGSCILLSSCPTLLSLVRRRPVTNATTTRLRQSQCGFVAKEPKVCCESVDPILSSKSGEDKSRYLPGASKCGQQTTDRILGGEIAELDEFPWMVLLEYTKPKGKGFYCGGVLISARYVLTAAHCVNGKDIPKNWRLTGVRAGEWNTSSSTDCSKDGVCSPPVVNAVVQLGVSHPQYDPQSTTQENDIALLRLQQPIKYSDYIQPICLPLSNAIQMRDYSQQDLFVAGWGRTEKSWDSEVKRKLSVPIVSKEECGRVYKSAGVQLGPGQLCAGGLRGRDSCRGDSGGPLMAEVQHEGRINWYAAGVVSFGPSPCGMDGWPGVYTRVDRYVQWILDTIED